MPASELLRDRERLATAVQEAGAIAKKFFRGPLKQWTKGQGDSPVTEADIASNDLLHKRLVEPGDGWLSEESENDPTRLAARRVWVVDPIDGTRAFIAGREDWSVSVALVVDGRPVARRTVRAGDRRAVPVDRGRRRDAERRRDPGQFRRQPRRCPRRRAQAHDGADRVQAAPALCRCRASIRWRCGSRGWRDGELDAAIAGGNGHDWDLAAADLLVHEAGGMMTALDGRVLIYNRPDPVHSVVLAAGRDRHAALADLIRAQTSEPV